MASPVYGLLYPLRRGAEDFAAASGAPLRLSNIRKVLATKAASEDALYRGEYPWRLGFGAGIDRIRHGNYEEFTGTLIRVYATDALARWEPTAEVTGGDITFDTRAEGGHLLRLSIGSGERPAAEPLELPL